MKAVNLTTKSFGRWTVLEFSHTSKKVYYWKCRCECGAIKAIASANLIRGKSLSCGCLAKELASKREKTHGLSKSRTYRIWAGMKTRCTNPNETSWKYYGGRGIKLCDRWEKFQNFLEDMGEAPSKSHSIERMNVNGNYCKENCRWIEFKFQARNTTKNTLITHNGVTLCAAEWCEKLKVPYKLIMERIARGLTFEQAVSKKKRVTINGCHKLIDIASA